MSDIIHLTPKIVWRITADPAIYTQAPFLKPIKNAALALHTRLKSGAGCSGCVQNAVDQVSVQLANAFSKLTVDESRKKPNALGSLKEVMGKILNLKLKEVRIQYKTTTGGDAELVF